MIIIVHTAQDCCERQGENAITVLNLALRGPSGRGKGSDTGPALSPAGAHQYISSSWFHLAFLLLANRMQRAAHSQM